MKSRQNDDIGPIIAEVRAGKLMSRDVLTLQPL